MRTQQNIGLNAALVAAIEHFEEEEQFHMLQPAK